MRLGAFESCGHPSLHNFNFLNLRLGLFLILTIVLGNFLDLNIWFLTTWFILSLILLGNMRELILFLDRFMISQSILHLRWR